MEKMLFYIKKILLIVGFVGSIGILASCGSDDDREEETETTIMDRTLVGGEWRITSISNNLEILNPVPCDKLQKLIFNEDGTVEKSFFSDITVKSFDPVELGSRCEDRAVKKGVYKKEGTTKLTLFFDEEKPKEVSMLIAGNTLEISYKEGDVVVSESYSQPEK